MMNMVGNSSLGDINDVDNNHQKNNVSSLSSKAIILMIIVLVITIIIFFDNFITSMDWYSRLRITASLSAIKDRPIKKQNQLSTKANTFISVFSILLIASIIITFLLMQDLF